MQRSLAVDPDSKTAERLTTATIADVVRAFYARIAADNYLGDAFNEALGGSWGPHVDRSCRFWSSVMLPDDADACRPPPDLRVECLSPYYFERWIAIFRATARDRWSSPLGEAFASEMERVARELRSSSRLPVYPGPLPGELELTPNHEQHEPRAASGARWSFPARLAAELGRRVSTLRLLPGDGRGEPSGAG